VTQGGLRDRLRRRAESKASELACAGTSGLSTRCSLEAGCESTAGEPGSAQEQEGCRSRLGAFAGRQHKRGRLRCGQSAEGNERRGTLMQENIVAEAVTQLRRRETWTIGGPVVSTVEGSEIAAIEDRAAVGITVISDPVTNSEQEAARPCAIRAVSSV
jgi:hypothetical protein